MTITNEELRGLVDWEQGLISPRIFIDEEIYQLELEKIFSRTWLFLAHDSMIPNPGDFFSTYMGGDPVIISRQKDGSVRTFLNVCRHRGMKVCRAEEGNTNAFMCTYHGWTYDGSGALVSVPNFEDAYYGELDMSKWGLVQIRVESYKGMYFGNFDATAPPLLEYLGEMTYYIDGWLDRYEGGIKVIPGAIKWTIKGNWKIAAEQFGGDGYHGQVTHSSSYGIIRAARENELGLPGSQQPGEGRQVATRQGHGEGFPVRTVAQAHFEDDVFQKYREDELERGRERLGADRPLAGHWTVFPNFSGAPGASLDFRIWHPKGPNEFQIWSFAYTDKAAPEEIRKAQQRGASHILGAGGKVEIDDGENWGLMGDVLRDGSQARRIAWNYQMGLGHERDDDPKYPGRIGLFRFGETPQRGMYRRWLEFMTSDEWPVVPLARVPSSARSSR